MTEELDNKLVKYFPNLYRDRYIKNIPSSMSYGFACGNGWFQLLWDLSEKLEPICVANKNKWPVAVQVKEKFGALRFYLNAAEDVGEKEYNLVNSYVTEAENISAKTCEDCGKGGQTLSSPTGWLMTLCNKCNRDTYHNKYSNGVD